MISSKDCKGIELMKYVRAEGLLWAGQVVRTVENGISKWILEGNLGSRRPVGKPRQSWENELRKDVAGLLRTNNWLAAAKYNNNWREKTTNAVTRKRAGEPLEEGHGRTEENHEKSQECQCHDRNPNHEPHNLVGNVRSSIVSLGFMEFRWP